MHRRLGLSILIVLVILHFSNPISAQDEATSACFGELMECVISESDYTAEEIDAAVSGLELYLVLNGYLQEVSLGSYITLFSEVEHEKSDLTIDRLAQQDFYTPLHDVYASLAKCPPHRLCPDIEFVRSSNLYLTGSDMLRNEYEESYMKLPYFRLYLATIILRYIDVDQGLDRRLTRSVTTDQVDPPIRRERMLSINLTSENKVSIEGQFVSLTDVRTIVKGFLLNTEPPYERVIDQDTFMIPPVHLLVVLLQADHDVSYQSYVELHNEVVAAYGEVRNEISLLIFQRSYDELLAEEQGLIRSFIPMIISEVEPIKP